MKKTTTRLEIRGIVGTDPYSHSTFDIDLPQQLPQILWLPSFGTTKFRGTRGFSALSHGPNKVANHSIGSYKHLWTRTGQVQNYHTTLGMGDLLTGKISPVIDVNRYIFHLRAPAFFVRFYRNNNSGVNGWYSADGAFT